MLQRHNNINFQDSINIFHEVSYFSAYVTNLTECTLCKQQYVGKPETPFNMRLNNQRNDVNNPHPKMILTFKHLQEKNHDFHKRAKYIILDKLSNKKKNLKKFCDNT